MTAVLNADVDLSWDDGADLGGPAPTLDSGLIQALRATYGLSRREIDVLHLIACGLSNQEIADTLYLSINSVKTYIRAAYRRVGVVRRSQAVAWSVPRGLGYRAQPFLVPVPRAGD